MDEKLFEAIGLFIGNKTGRDPGFFKSSTRLEKDLGIYGDDASELINAYGKKFNVDISNLKLSEYFDGEGLDSFGGIIDLFKMRITHVPNKVLTIEHMVNGVKAGKLDEG